MGVIVAVLAEAARLVILELVKMGAEFQLMTGEQVVVGQMAVRQLTVL